MSNPDSQQEMIRAASELAEEIRLIREDLTPRLEAAEKEETRSRHLIHRLIGTVAVLALLLAGAAAGFAVWNHHQDDVRMAARTVYLEKEAVQDQRTRRLAQENAQFRVRFCAMVRDAQVRLRDEPTGTRAGQEASARLIASLATLCTP